MTGIREEYSDYENRTYNTNYYATNATLTYSPRLGTTTTAFDACRLERRGEAV